MNRHEFFCHADDIAWLRDTYLRLSPPFGSFCLWGSKDDPDLVELYDSPNPDLMARPVAVYERDSRGGLMRTDQPAPKVVGLAEELRCIACFDKLSPADCKAVESAADRIDALEAALREAVLLLDKSDDDFVNDFAFVELAKNLLNR